MRNLLRIVDGFGGYLVGFLVAVLSRQRQRLGDHLDQLQHGAGVPEAQLQPAGILRTDQPMLVALHRKRHDGTGRDRIERVAATQLVRFGDGLKLLEFASSSCATMTALAILLADGNNRGGGDLPTSL